MCLQDDAISRFIAALGEPKRYVYSASDFTGYVLDDSGDYRQVHAYCVDFEIACDCMDIKDAKGDKCIFNPHIINVLEPGLHGDEYNPYISHVTLLDESAWCLLQAYSNTDDLSCKYSGVVEGYSIQDIRSLFNQFDVDNTGLCLLPSVVARGGLRKPVIPFNETKHKRFVQTSMAYRTKLTRKAVKNGLVPRQMPYHFLYQPVIYKLSLVESM